MGIRGFRLGCVLIGVLLICLLPCSIRAQEAGAGSAAYRTAGQAIRIDKPQDALGPMQQAILEDPENLEYQYQLGGIYLRLGRLDEAEVIFRALIAQNEEAYRKAWFDVAHIRSRRGDDAGAVEALEKARPADPGRADYEIGLCRMKLNEYRKAIGSFRKAGAARPDLAPRTIAQEGICFAHLKEYKEARESLEAALKMDQPPETAAELRKLLAAVENAARVGKPWHVTGAVGFQYDSNVLQDSLDEAARASGEGDGAFVANVTGSYDFYRDDSWRVGAAYNHYQVTYFTQSDSGVIGARPALYAQLNKAPFYPGLEYQYSHFWAGGDSKADVQTVVPNLTIVHDEHWRTYIRGEANWRFFRDVTPDDRVYNIGITEMYMMKGGKAHIRAGYLMTLDDLVDSERTGYVSHGGLVGFQYPVYREWFVDVSGLFMWRDYDFDPVISLTRTRRDTEQDLNVLLRGPITSNLQMNFLFQYIWNDSNIVKMVNNESFDPYNYRRAIFTCFLTFDY